MMLVNLRYVVIYIPLILFCWNCSMSEGIVCQKQVQEYKRPEVNNDLLLLADRVVLPEQCFFVNCSGVISQWWIAFPIPRVRKGQLLAQLSHGDCGTGAGCSRFDLSSPHHLLKM